MPLDGLHGLRGPGEPVMETMVSVVVCAVLFAPVSYTHLRAHETVLDLVCRLLLEKKNKICNYDGFRV